MVPPLMVQLVHVHRILTLTVLLLPRKNVQGRKIPDFVYIAISKKLLRLKEARFINTRH